MKKETVKVLPEALTKKLESSLTKGREIKKSVKYPCVGETFSAIGKAQEDLRKHGYIYGSMQREAPMAIAKASKVSYISKWHSIYMEDAHKIEGVILSEDFREGDVYVIYFKPLKGAVKDSIG
jgi:hypothetical protein